MKGKTQRECNPFPHSDSNKRYYSFDFYLRSRYGGKCAVVPLDAGMTCPNIDGVRGVGGCIYCSNRGSGEFAGNPAESLTVQYENIRKRIRGKWDCRFFLPYLQAHTNTYAPLSRLRAVFSEVAAMPDAVGIHIATRADCLDPERAELLAELSDRKDVTVELGLQSTSDETARRINRCHTYAEFLAGFRLLREIAPKARICVHLINGLPGEDETQMISSAREMGLLGIDEVKIHLLHVLRGTALSAMYEAGEYTPMSEEAYARTVVHQLEVLPQNCVIGRLTGDGAPEQLLAPEWSRKKLQVLDRIDRMLYESGTYQGRLFSRKPPNFA